MEKYSPMIRVINYKAMTLKFLKKQVKKQQSEVITFTSKGSGMIPTTLSHWLKYYTQLGDISYTPGRGPYITVKVLSHRLKSLIKTPAPQQDQPSPPKEIPKEPPPALTAPPQQDNKEKNEKKTEVKTFIPTPLPRGSGPKHSPESIIKTLPENILSKSSIPIENTPPEITITSDIERSLNNVIFEIRSLLNQEQKSILEPLLNKILQNITRIQDDPLVRKSFILELKKIIKKIC